VFLKRPLTFLFLLYSFGVFGVGSESVTYLPVNNDPLFLDIVPMGLTATAMLPAVLAPALAPPLAVSIISRALIVAFLVYIYELRLWD
jgi:hypothetical protein